MSVYISFMPARCFAIALSVLNREVAPVSLPLFCSYKVVLRVAIRIVMISALHFCGGLEEVIPEWLLFILIILLTRVEAG